MEYRLFRFDCSLGLGRPISALLKAEKVGQFADMSGPLGSICASWALFIVGSWVAAPQPTGAKALRAQGTVRVLFFIPASLAAVSVGVKASLNFSVPSCPVGQHFSNIRFYCDGLRFLYYWRAELSLI